jgi:hypothetical protein
MIWTSSASKYAGVSLESALTAADSALLSRLVAPAEEEPSKTLLQVVTGGVWTSSNSPDFLAVRTGPAVTPQFSGGGEVTSWTNGGTGTVVTYFGGGTAGNAFKGVAISYGPDATAGDRANEKLMAMGWLSQHLSDHQPGDGRWNQPLIDASL